MNKPKIYIPKEVLIELYINKKQSLEQIGKIYNVCGTTILNYLKKYKIDRRKSGSVLLHDISNQQFGHWILTTEHQKIDGHTRWKALCTLCNKYHWVLNRTLTHGDSKKCFFCERDLKKKTAGEMWQSYWASIEHGAKSRNLEFNITAEYIWNLFLTQERKCIYSGVELKFGYKSEQTASLDRIDNNKGYIEGNVQWIHKHLNRIKMNSTEEEFLKWCSLVHHYQISKNIITDFNI